MISQVAVAEKHAYYVTTKCSPGNGLRMKEIKKKSSIKNYRISVQVHLATQSTYFQSVFSVLQFQNDIRPNKTAHIKNNNIIAQ